MQNQGSNESPCFCIHHSKHENGGVNIHARLFSHTTTAAEDAGKHADAVLP